jgi:hypothetical protein
LYQVSSPITSESLRPSAVLDRIDRDAGLLCELREGAVVVEPEHRGDVLGREVLGVGGQDHGVGVGRVADHDHLGVALGALVESLTLRTEDFGIGIEEVAALHALRARARADEEPGVDVAEGGLRVVGDDDVLQQRERAILELHHDALHGLLGLGQVEKLERDGGVLAVDVAVGDAEQERVADLAGRAGDGDTFGLRHGITFPTLRSRRACGPALARSAPAIHAENARCDPKCGFRSSGNTPEHPVRGNADAVRKILRSSTVDPFQFGSVRMTAISI